MYLRTRGLIARYLYLPEPRHLEMIPNHLIWSNFIIFRLNFQQIAAQHISVLGYRCCHFFGRFQVVRWNRSLGVLHYHWTADCTVTLLLSRFVPRWTYCCGRCFLSINYRYTTINVWRCKAFLSQELRGHPNHLLFCDSCLCASTTRIGKKKHSSFQKTCTTRVY
jgi:hypothetical protein